MKLSVKTLNPVFRIIRWAVDVFYPKTEIIGAENIPDEPVVIVGNHAQMHGPIVCELYFPQNFFTWCSGQMMHLRDVPDYAFEDFWSRKPPYIAWFFRILSFVIAPLSVIIFNNARTVPVYRDKRILVTFKRTVEKLEKGDSIVIFPEYDTEYNNILFEFSNRFIDIAKPYYKRTGKELCFVPIYIAPSLKKVYIGKAVRFCADAPIDEERIRICNYLMTEITNMATALPLHTVVPYRNVPKKMYPTNIKAERNIKNGDTKN